LICNNPGEVLIGTHAPAVRKAVASLEELFDLLSLLSSGR